MTGIPSACIRCALPLDPNNITGVCLECKHIERDRRRGFTAPEAPLAESRATFMAAFRGRFRRMDASVLYLRGACRNCARFRARRDTGLCEWCGGPRRFPRKRSKRKAPEVVNAS